MGCNMVVKASWSALDILPREGWFSADFKAESSGYFVSVCLITVFFQEVELKYHQLCQSQGEAATTEDNNQGGFVFSFLKANRINELTACLYFPDGVQRWRNSRWQNLSGYSNASRWPHIVIQSSTADVAVRARLIVTESPQTHWQKDGTEQDFMNNETLEIGKYGTDVQTTDGDLFSAVILSKQPDVFHSQTYLTMPHLNSATFQKVFASFYFRRLL